LPLSRSTGGGSGGRLGGLHLDKFTLRAWLWYREPFHLQTINVEDDRLPNQADHLISRLSDSDTAGEIRNVTPPT